MATAHKKLSRAKAQGVVDAIDKLLRDTEWDDRLTLVERAPYMEVRKKARELVGVLAKDERDDAA